MIDYKMSTISAPKQRQVGVALVVVLIFMVVLTSISIYAARNSSLSERIARNQLDIEVARQAAEAALRDAEFDLLLPTAIIRSNALCARTAERPLLDSPLGMFDPTCTHGQCTLSNARYEVSNYSTATSTSLTGEPWWPAAKGGLWGDNSNLASTACTSFTGGVPYGTYSGRVKITGVRRQPEYLIELLSQLNENFTLFRITSRGFGRNATTEVVLQSYFALPRSN